MDMNASYNKLVTKHRLYMIGFICSRNLAEMFSALFVWMKLVGIKPKKKILADISDDTDKETIKSLKQEAKAEKQEYSQLKKLR